MNGSLLSGLAMGLGSLADNMALQNKNDEEDRRQERKAKLAAQLQMDMLKAKQSYAESHPTYKDFKSTLDGDYIAFDDKGNAKVVQGSDEAHQLAKDKVAGINAYRDAQAQSLLGQQDPKIALMKSTAARNTAEAAKALRPPAPKKIPLPPGMIFPDQAAKKEDEMLTTLLGKNYKQDLIPDMDYQTASAAIASGKAGPMERDTVAQYQKQQEAKAKAKQAISSYKVIDANEAAKYSAVPTGLLAAPQASPEETPDPFADIDSE